jgi:hypothetical protein
VRLQVNARKVQGEPNVLEGLDRQPLFLAIIAAEAALQVGGGGVELLWGQQRQLRRQQQTARALPSQHHAAGSTPPVRQLPSTHLAPTCVHSGRVACRGLFPWPPGVQGSAVRCAPQVAIVQAGGRVFGTVPLSPRLWAVCVGFGAGSLLVGAVLRALPPLPAFGGGLRPGEGRGR